MMSFIHISGPLNGYDVLVAIATAPERLRYAYDPDLGYLPTLDDGEIEYRLDREHSDLRPNPRVPGMEEGEAAYVICHMPE